MRSTPIIQDQKKRRKRTLEVHYAAREKIAWSHTCRRLAWGQGTKTFANKDLIHGSCIIDLEAGANSAFEMGVPYDRLRF